MTDLASRQNGGMLKNRICENSFRNDTRKKRHTLFMISFNAH